MSHAHPHPHPHPPQGQPQPVQITQEQLKQLTPQQLQQLAMLQQQQRMQQQQQQQAPRADPVMQQIIDADFKPVPLKLGEPNNSMVSCAAHGLEVCTDCKLDFSQLNLLTKALVNRPDIAFPPPPQPQFMHPARSVAVTKTKDEGNNHFKAGRFPQAVQMYTMAANIAVSREPWEQSGTMREELALVLCNRSAAHLSNGEAEQALLDANLVVQYKAPWGKGHFRRAKALVALGRLQEAHSATANALQFEPQSQETQALLAEIERELKKQEAAGIHSPVEVEL